MGLVRVGIDIGGAFTDLVVYDEFTKHLTWVKVESTPRELSAGVLECIRRSGIPFTEFSQIIHGQTVVINTIIERKGARVGLLTTRGHRDVLELQRGNRRDMYNLRYKKPDPIVPRYLRIEVDERTMADGSVLSELNEEQVAEAAKKLVENGVEVICVAFLNSYVGPGHELEAGDIMEKNTHLPVVLSHQVTREWREYERFSTAALNAYVLPILEEYLARLQKAQKNASATWMAMTSEGGMVSFDYARKFPIYTVESGPVAGVMGAIGVAGMLGERNIIALDGGSTTTKTSLVEDLSPKLTTEYFVERDRFNPGLPIIVPVIKTVEVGNGGTSIAWIDSVGRVRVGPRAAGADPGPACYGKGGSEPTLTDAYVVAGLLNQMYLLGGELAIDRNLAAKAVSGIADQLGTTLDEAAEGIIKLANDNAAYAISLVSVQRGYDPRDFTLIAYGGSGPMFAPFIAEELDIERIVVPAIPPGVFSAWGMLNSDIHHSTVLTHIARLDSPSAHETINRIYGELESEIREVFSSDGIIEGVVLERFADMRYHGQEHTVRVPISSGTVNEGALEKIIAEFHRIHDREYEFKLVGDPVELVNFHVVGVKRVKKLELGELSGEGSKTEEALMENRRVYLNGAHHLVPVYDRPKLSRGAIVVGPSILEDPTATILVLPSQSASVDRFGNITIRRLG